MIDPKDFNASCRDQLGSYIDGIKMAKYWGHEYKFNVNGPGLFIRSPLSGWYLYRGPNGKTDVIRGIPA